MGTTFRTQGLFLSELLSKACPPASSSTTQVAATSQSLPLAVPIAPRFITTQHSHRRPRAPPTSKILSLTVPLNFMALWRLTTAAWYLETRQLASLISHSLRSHLRLDFQVLMVSSASRQRALATDLPISGPCTPKGLSLVLKRLSGLMTPRLAQL